MKTSNCVNCGADDNLCHLEDKRIDKPFNEKRRDFDGAKMAGRRKFSEEVLAAQSASLPTDLGVLLVMCAVARCSLAGLECTDNEIRYSFRLFGSVRTIEAIGRCRGPINLALEQNVIRYANAEDEFPLRYELTQLGICQLAAMREFVSGRIL